MTLTVMTGLDAGRHVLLEDRPLVLGRSPDTDLVIDDPGVSRRHAAVGGSSEEGFFVEDLGSTNGTFVDGQRVERAALTSGSTIQLGPDACVRLAVSDAVEELLQRQLYEASIRDPLTHAFSRKYFGDRLKAEVARARRGHAEVSLIIVDIDHFKSLNDGYGHLAGDRALSAVAAAVARTVRAEDLLARLGGDEFAILADNADRAQALQLAERIQRRIRNLHFGVSSGTLSVTLSVGVASLQELPRGRRSPSALFALADRRLYEAKATGRDRVCSDG